MERTIMEPSRATKRMSATWLVKLGEFNSLKYRSVETILPFQPLDNSMVR